jgi:hypothetical protein
MEPHNGPNESDASKDSLTGTLSIVTPLSKSLAMILFIVLPFVGGYIGYLLAPLKVVEVERYVIKESETPAQGDESVGYESGENAMFPIANVQVNSRLVMGEWTTVSWDFTPGTYPENARVNFQLVRNDGVVVNPRLHGAASPDVYAQGTTSVYIPTLCSVVPSEGCIDDSLYDPNGTFVLSVTGQRCTDGKTLPGYCMFHNAQLLETEAVKSNEFRLERYR